LVGVAVGGIEVLVGVSVETTVGVSVGIVVFVSVKIGVKVRVGISVGIPTVTSVGIFVGKSWANALPKDIVQEKKQSTARGILGKRF
jgi:hypothetical protein